MMGRKLKAAYQESALNTTKYYNKKFKPMMYRISNKVWLLGKNLTTIRLYKKLDRKFDEPFQVLGTVGKNAHQLKLPLRLKIHPVFYVLLLEPANKTRKDVSKPLLPLEVDGKEEYYMEDALDSKY